MSTERLALGDRVKILGTLHRNKVGRSLSYDESGPPIRIGYPENKVFTEGVIVGSRTVYDGQTFYDDFGAMFDAEKHHNVYLVAFDMRMNPAYCRPDQVERI